MLIRNATLADGRRRDVRVEGEYVTAVADPETLEGNEGEDVRDATGKRLLPGMIDVHVHFRQPGFSHKETWETGTRSAAAGGVTTVVDQPNTEPPTVDGNSFEGKSEFAADALVDYGINGGVTPEWRPDELFDCPLFALGEVFLADSTGEMGIGADLFADALERADAAGVPVTVHAEDASQFNESAREREDPDAWSAYRSARAEAAAVKQACELAAERDTEVHIAHASTPRGIDIAADAGMTTEVTPHHMFLSRSDSHDLGTFGRMNPPLRREKRRQRVFDRVADGTVDMVATDHAPHTREEKDASIWEAPSGVPGVETALPLLLAEARSGRLDYERVRDLTAANPADVFNVPEKGRVAEGYQADLVLVDTGETHTIRGEDLHTKCDWTPFEGRDAVFPEWTMVRGTVVYERDAEDPFTDHAGRNARIVPSADPTVASDRDGGTPTGSDRGQTAGGPAMGDDERDQPQDGSGRDVSGAVDSTQSDVGDRAQTTSSDEDQKGDDQARDWSQSQGGARTQDETQGEASQETQTQDETQDGASQETQTQDEATQGTAQTRDQSPGSPVSRGED